MAPPTNRQRRPQRDAHSTEDVLSFGAWLRQRRRALDLTQGELAQRAGCARITIRRMEADELKPSQQLAELLASHLGVPTAQRDVWLSFARSLAMPLPSPTPSRFTVNLPHFLQQPTPFDSAQPRLFVAREQELAQLQRWLDLAYAGQGRVTFVTGEAGSGKSTLVQEFARLAQQQRPGLVVAMGSCQAFAGIGDPYLPFRELLAMLTGDVEARWAAGAISREHATTLWSLLPQVVPLLLANSVNLIDTFIPGAALLQRAQAAAPTGAPWVTQLATMVSAQATANAPGLQQQDLFAQTTRLLLGIARQQPLLLILDDLQWADAGSLHLLFHLGRQLAGSRILLLGLYRVADVELGRPALMNEPAPTMATERHPLAPIVAELQRTFGERPIDLQQADGRTFVQALLASLSHRLRPTSAVTLYQHTEGQALFTVELLRSMQVRGDLVQDDQGTWVEGPTLSWETLPAQVEGIIGERIGRMSQPLQTLLAIAAVEGEIFTAEVIAHVQGIRVAQVVGQLSNVLVKQHGLVRVQDVQHLPTGRLAHYRFRHHLFQKYLYQRLDDAERATLHEAVGQALVHCYGRERATIAPQLARHFELAGQTEMALTYLQQAGDTAVRLYANSEAANYYCRALALATPPATSSTELLRLFTHFSPILELDAQYDQALAAYTTLEQLARQRGDQVLELAAVMAKLPIYASPTPLQDPIRGHTLGHKALHLARTLHDQEAEAKILWTLSIGAVQTLQIEQAIAYGEESLALARRLQFMEQTALTLTHLGFFCYTPIGRYTDSETALSEANTIWGRLSNLLLIAHNLAMLGILYTAQGKYEQALAVRAEARQIAQQSDAPWSDAFSTWTEGYIYWEQGDVDRACQVISTCIHAAEQGGNILIEVEDSVSLATIYFELGAFERGSAVASAVATIVEANEHYCYMPIIRSHEAKTLGQLYLSQHRLAEAEDLLAGDHINLVRKAMPAYFAWCDVDRVYAEVFFQQQAYDRALALIEQWLGTLRQFGTRSRLPYALHMQGKIHLTLGDQAAARASWQAARSEAEALGSRWALWQILASLAQIEVDADHAAQLCQEAQIIITYIADHISDAELRASFLDLSAVRAVAAPGK